MPEQAEPTLQEQQVADFQAGQIQGYKEQIAMLTDKVAELRGEINWRNGVIKTAQKQLKANDETQTQQMELIGQLQQQIATLEAEKLSQTAPPPAP